jgi:hypothetical protein
MAVINPQTKLGYNNKSGFLSGTKDYYRDKNLKKLYKLSLSDWVTLFEQQGNRCAICGSDKPRGKNWHTDHCHTTRRIRGILCGWCNTAIGKLQENPALFIKALSYLGDTGIHERDSSVQTIKG